MNKRLGFAITAVILLAPGCSILPEPKPIDFYTLKPAQVSHSAAVSKRQISVAEPELADMLQLERILRVANNGSIVAYSEARWSAPIALVWQNWLLDALWRDARFDDISSRQQGLDAQWQVAGRLQAFHIIESTAGAFATVRFDAQLIDIKNRRLTASKTFQAEVALNDSSAASAVQALGHASEQVGEDLLSWLAEPH
ncbi:ABC-type transport auxiliary lipoprotein family protein [Pseudidiomarina gelatinasegens]|jgi:cholesterol transport system auxiliary component|uniref:ABC-type transport auxiliary lipoprotein family protein n=1 Tax=Pseudidiomarina gelatinasegens TaxID=2487740 RepID=UPI0030ED3315|tara:strand:- start:456 stop:1049 length:594 start_codon:yes stop_codon:yes gene_type:complete